MRSSFRSSPRGRSRLVRATVGATLAVGLLAGIPATAQAATPSYPSDSNKPDLVTLLDGFSDFWQSDGVNDLHGTVKDPQTLEHNDQLTVWVNNHATKQQQFRAMQDSEYDNGGAYDQSVTISDSLGSILGPIYVQGRNTGALPLTSALINSGNGTTGAYVSTSAPKAYYSYPRPFLPVDADAQPVAGDDAACAPSLINASSVKSIRVGKSYTDADGDLKIKRVPDVTDTTHQFSPNDVPLSAGYGTAGICTGGAFPSGHTTTAYQAGVTLATLLPELAPEILARTSEAGNNRIVLGVHYPLDIVGGRIDGEVALATRWSDTQFRTQVLQPARDELINYLQSKCGGTLLQCIAREKQYSDNPYGGQQIPGGTAQIVTNRASAAAVYHERLTYGFTPVGPTWLAPSVPAGADNLLLTAFPTLTDAQRTSILAQTEIRSGYPLDGTLTSDGSWERLDLAAALSATVRVNPNGSVTVLKTGGLPQVEKTATLTTNGQFVAAGDQVRLTGSGFVAGQHVTLVLHSNTAVTLGTATADAHGRVSTTVTIPRGTSWGAHTIDAVDASGSSVLVKPLTIIVTPAKGGPGHWWPRHFH